MKTGSIEALESSLGLAVGTAKAVFTESGGCTVTGQDSIPITVLVSCEQWRLRAMCTRRGKDAAVVAGIAALATNQQQVANARWSYCGAPIQRDEWLSKHLRVWMGYTNKQFDDFFTSAQALY